jgi:hypothetical protein
MLWMGRWIHHHATSTILVGEEIRELAEFLDHSKAGNDVKVGWLRPQTHMEWFPPPPYTPTRCLRQFICCGWADGSTIMSLQLYLLAKRFRSWQSSWNTARLQLDHSKAANDVKVDWLRPQTHMEWFPNPLNTYYR